MGLVQPYSTRHERIGRVKSEFDSGDSFGGIGSDWRNLLVVTRATVTLDTVLGDSDAIVDVDKVNSDGRGGTRSAV